MAGRGAGPDILGDRLIPFPRYWRRHGSTSKTTPRKSNMRCLTTSPIPKRARIWRGAMIVRPAWLEKNSARSMRSQYGRLPKQKNKHPFFVRQCENMPAFCAVSGLGKGRAFGLTGALPVAGRPTTRPPTSDRPLPERWQSGRMRRTRNAVYRQRLTWVRIPPLSARSFIAHGRAADRFPLGPEGQRLPIVFPGRLTCSRSFNRFPAPPFRCEKGRGDEEMSSAKPDLPVAPIEDAVPAIRGIAVLMTARSHPFFAWRRGNPPAIGG